MHLIACADDLYLFATEVDQMEAIVKSLRDLAHRTIALSLRPDKCKWANVHRTSGPVP